MWINKYLMLVLISALTINETVAGCFPVQMFNATFRWMQSVSLHSRWFVDITQFEPSEITMRSEGLDSQRKIIMKCLRPWGAMSYLVQVNEKDSKKYQCIRFQSLSKYVVRLHKSSLYNTTEINCAIEQYTTDDAVLFAHEVPAESCALTGGYQLMLHQSEAVGQGCLDSVESYNPKLQFECDVIGNGGVRAEFGQLCEPSVLTESLRMRRRRTTKLYCVGSWEEGAGYKSVLMRMENAPLVTWCLQYKKKNDQQEDEFYSVFLSLEGKCSNRAFASHHDLTSNSSMYGFMARYTPGDDLKCTSDSYLQSCESKTLDTCLESSECPSNCKRCVEPAEKEFCIFDSETFGDYQLIGSSQKDFNVTVTNKFINGTTFGEFECRGFAETGLSGSVYPVFQAGSIDTCMPYYACAQVTPLTTGVIAFNLKSAKRNEETGAPLSCWETHEVLGEIYPVFLQRTITLVDRSIVSEIPCQIDSNSFNTYSGCRLVVESCQGNCTTMTVGYDQLTCPRTTVNPYNIEFKHSCWAKFKIHGGHVILATSNDVGRELCWIFLKDRLYIANAESCNQDAIEILIKNPDSVIKYDPINAISQPVSGSGGSYDIVGASRSLGSRIAKYGLAHFLLVIIFLIF